jgi:hypothetical protein
MPSSPRPGAVGPRYGVPTTARASLAEPTPWTMPARSIAWRLFLTSWLVYALHVATDVVREHYPALALGDHLSFRLDEYGGLTRCRAR